MEIILIRHGRPDVNINQKIYATQLKLFVDKYNKKGISFNSFPPKKLKESIHSIILSSDLKRSVDSVKALQLSDKVLIDSDSLFREAGIPFANWKGVRLKAKTWFVIFRILWCFGYSNGCESKYESTLRAKRGAKKLIEYSNQHKSVTLMGHGIMNKLLSNELKSLGWREKNRWGFSYWGVRVLQKD